MSKKLDDVPALDAPKPKGQIVHDQELLTMGKINRLIDKLEPKAKIRVVSWLKDKLDFPLVDSQAK